MDHVAVITSITHVATLYILVQEWNVEVSCFRAVLRFRVSIVAADGSLRTTVYCTLTNLCQCGPGGALSPYDCVLSSRRRPRPVGGLERHLQPPFPLEALPLPLFALPHVRRPEAPEAHGPAAGRTRHALSGVSLGRGPAAGSHWFPARRGARSCPSDLFDRLNHLRQRRSRGYAACD